jgi:ribosomal protein S8
MNNFIFADLIARIKVGYKARLLSIKVLKNKLTINFLFLLYKIGLIRSFYMLHNEKNILIYLKYNNNRPVIHSMDLVSKPSRRVY